MSRRAAAALLGCSLAIGACGARTSLDGASIYGDGGGSSGRGGSDPGPGGQSARGGATASGGSMAVGGKGGVAGAPNPSLCGDGILHPGEECDLGIQNEDCPALLLSQAAFSWPVSPLVTADTVESFYAYSSASSHTGYEQVGKSRLLLHRSTFDESLSLVMHHGIDDLQPGDSYVHFLITTSGFATGSAFVTLSDEATPELQQTSLTEFVGDWAFHGNSDGGVIGGLPFPSEWIITVHPSFVSNIDGWDFVDGPAAYVVLDPTLPVQIATRLLPTSCRLDCTAPRCGDGLLDAGEVCDDGNAIDGDGCSACRPF